MNLITINKDLITMLITLVLLVVAVASVCYYEIDEKFFVNSTSTCYCTTVPCPVSGTNTLTNGNFCSM